MYRTVARIVAAQHVMEGGGFPVRRPFPTRDLAEVDPFLLLDEMGPVDWAPAQAVGAPDHPHRGFETATYLLEGRMEHRDSHGNHGLLGPGDVQWMTAGAGVVHSELPTAGFMREGGRVHGFQLWVNLPRAHKMAAPRYQDVPASRIPQASVDGQRVEVRVIAGRSLGVAAVVDTYTPILYLHFTIQPGGRISQPVPRGFGLFAYVFGGCVAMEPPDEGDGPAAHVGPLVTTGNLVLFAADGDEVHLAAPADGTVPLDLLLVGGRPIDEPVVRYGPFVMNSEEELRQAFEDYRTGRMGRIVN